VLSLYLGPSDLLITLDVTFADSLERDDIDRTIDEMERSIVRAFPQTTRIFIEPENIGSTTKSARRLQELTDRA